VGILQEHAMNRILQDLAALLVPRSLVVEGWFKERGGISTHARAEHPAKRRE